MRWGLLGFLYVLLHVTHVYQPAMFPSLQPRWLTRAPPTAPSSPLRNDAHRPRDSTQLAGRLQCI